MNEITTKLPFFKKGNFVVIKITPNRVNYS